MPDDTPDPLATALRDRRRALGLKQADVAAKIGREQSTISEIENGRTWPTLRVLRRLADALDCDITVTPRNPPVPP